MEERHDEIVILQQPVGEFPSPFACVPWGHHIAIISKCKSVDEALFYIGKTIEQGMSRAALVNCINMLPTQKQLKERMELLQKELRETKRLVKSNK